ncbi:MAG: hypothetical protein QMD10_10560 [Desulfitobacteriaceae bacterium]|nr:hypothetical protein [Desulfitobacteriaceae bacterium]
MGMFDTLIVEEALVCPRCSGNIENPSFQFKLYREPFLNEYKIGDQAYKLDTTVEGTEICPHCQAMIRADITIGGGKVTGYSNIRELKCPKCGAGVGSITVNYKGEGSCDACGHKWREKVVEQF